MRIRALSVLLVATSGVIMAADPSLDDLRAQVTKAEAAFARSLATRDLAAFSALVAEDAVFFGKGGVVQRGKAAIVEAWRPLFALEKAPFSWAPEHVEVLASGTLAHSSGPVHDAAGKRFGTFNSVWRRERDGTWKVVLDKGCDDCAQPVKE